VIAEAAACLRRGGLVAFPTETVYGLGAHALDRSAVLRLFAAKGRPATDPVIVHLASTAALGDVACDIPPLAGELAQRFWPGPLTIILPKKAEVPDEVTAGLPTVAVRVPSHPVAHAIIEAAAIAVVAPSANRFSRPSPTTAAHVADDLGAVIDLIVDGGATTIGVESTVLDLTTEPPMVRRPGSVTMAMLAEVVPDVRAVHRAARTAEAQAAPGQLLRHYAPAAPLTLYVGKLEATADRVGHEARTMVARGLRVGILAPEEDLLELAPRIAAFAVHGRVLTVRYGSRAEPDASARQLFGAVREIDAAGVDQILAIASDADGIGLAIVDRLSRAAEGKVIRLLR
jgi:L-threonylcarbamoyladenylate synthase